MTVKAVSYISAAFLLFACTNLREDFDKASYLGRAELRESEPQVFSARLAEGNASMIIAIPGYNCLNVKPDATLDVSVRVGDAPPVSATTPLHALTCSFANRSCDAFGYAHDALQGVAIPKGDTQVTLTVGIRQVKQSSLSNQVLFWFVFGDRVPTRRIFGPV